MINLKNLSFKKVRTEKRDDDSIQISFATICKVIILQKGVSWFYFREIKIDFNFNFYFSLFISFYINI